MLDKQMPDAQFANFFERFLNYIECRKQSMSIKKYK